ncbi:MAG: response regulator [Clostridia bacterium]|nr:response regulator [Clostridia bacterium]
MAYTVILVDDEKLILNTFSKMIDWEEYGFKLAGSFQNAKKAIEWLDEHDADAVITDISMPGMDGLEFAEWLRKNRQGCCVALMSGYSDFDYAQKAIRYHVEDYLLKPVSIQSLTELLLKLSERIDEKRRDELTEENTDLTGQEQSIIDYLTGAEHDEQLLLKKLPGECDIPLMERPAAIIRIEIEQLQKYLREVWSYGRNRLITAVQNIVRTCSCFAIPYSRTFDSMQWLVLSNGRSINGFSEELAQLRGEIIVKCFENIELGVSVIIEAVEPDLKLMKDRMRMLSTDFQTAIIMKLVEQGNAEEIRHEVGRFYKMFADDEAAIRFYCKSIMEQLLNSYEELRLDSPQKKEDRPDLEQLLHIQNPDMLCALALDTAVRAARGYSEIDRASAVKMAKRYISEHLEEGVSLKNTAEFVHFSPSHFCRMFKTETGENFSDYVNKTRIEKAKLLLRTTDMKINDIYEKIGYKSRNYFYKMFKLYSGVTAQDYRNLNNKGIFGD